MRRIAPFQGSASLLASDVEQICKVIRDEGWKVSGCGLGQGALSCSLFLGEYAASCAEVDLTDQINQLFDRGCNGVVSGKTSWLDFADLALVAYKLHQRGLVEIEQEHFFEDIDKLALATMAQPGQIAGFANSDLAAALYVFRRFRTGAAQFEGPLRRFANTLVAGTEANFDFGARHQNQDLGSGLSAPLLFVSALAEMGLAGENDCTSGIEMLVGRIYENTSATTKDQISTGFQTGDLGIGYALLRGGMCFHRDQWIIKGLQMLIDCAYTVFDRGVGTLDLASGASGIALVFHKLYGLSGYHIFREVASNARWLSLKAGVTVDHRFIDRGYSFYHGLAGIGLATLHWRHGTPEALDELLWLL